jgi:uncharacterized membrane protein YfcA
MDINWLSLEHLVLAITALFVSCLTLFSGFGLGTLLLPAFAMFFPMGVAVAATAIVHLVNNLFKLGLLWRDANWRIAARFALPAALAALPGAGLLFYLEEMAPVASYTLGTRSCEVTIIKLVIAALIVIFAAAELFPALGKRLTFKPEHLLLGATLSGFFGGLSGHQGAFRSAVLLKFGLTKNVFVATGVVCAVVVDITRLMIYGTAFYHASYHQLAESGGFGPVAIAAGAAFLGAYIGARLLGKVTMRTVQRVVGIMLFLLGTAIGSGIV